MGTIVKAIVKIILLIAGIYVATAFLIFVGGTVLAFLGAHMDGG